MWFKANISLKSPEETKVLLNEIVEEIEVPTFQYNVIMMMENNI